MKMNRVNGQPSELAKHLADEEIDQIYALVLGTEKFANRLGISIDRVLAFSTVASFGVAYVVASHVGRCIRPGPGYGSIPREPQRRKAGPTSEPASVAPRPESPNSARAPIWSRGSSA